MARRTADWLMQTTRSSLAVHHLNSPFPFNSGYRHHQFRAQALCLEPELWPLENGFLLVLLKLCPTHPLPSSTSPKSYLLQMRSNLAWRMYVPSHSLYFVLLTSIYSLGIHGAHHLAMSDLRDCWPCETVFAHCSCTLDELHLTAHPWPIYGPVFRASL